MATRGTAVALQEAGVQAETVLKIQEGRPNAADLMKARRRPTRSVCRLALTLRLKCAHAFTWLTSL